MKRIEFWLRMVAYAWGLGGVALVWLADPAGRARTVGFLLMILMFVFFSAAHILRLTMQMRSIHRPRRAVDPWAGGRREPPGRGESDDPGTGAGPG
jgi:hypothetical protein